MKIKGFVMVMGLMTAMLIGQQSVWADSSKIPNQVLQLIGPKLKPLLTYEPFDPPLRNHLWMKTDPDKMIFFHFAKAATVADNTLLFMGDAIKGRFCAEDQPDGGKTGYIHFHSLRIAKGHKHGHGGEKGQEGYWLRHIALGEFDAMGRHFTPGVAHNFKATPPPSCK